MFRTSGAALLLVLSTAPAAAQGLPPFAPISPVAGARTGLAFEPYHEPAPRRWVLQLGLDYATTIEVDELDGATYVLDAELMRLELRARRDLGRRVFLVGQAELRGAYDGVFDGFLDWYHDLLGFEIPERERRPRDKYDYDVAPPGGLLLRAERSDLFLGDTRVGAGLRWSDALQSVAAVTLPTSTGPVGYGRGVVSVNLLNTVRTGRRLVYEGSLSLGYTATHGHLRAFQREVMVAASSGVRFGVWGRHHLYGNLFYHSPYYRKTTLPSLDRRELSLDFGWILAGRSGAGEWRLGLTEDLEPGGPAIDLVLRIGKAF